MHLTAVDIFLTAMLLLALPALRLWSTLKAGPRLHRAPMRRYLLTIGELLLLLGTLAAQWLLHHRSLAALGLDIPVGTYGLVGLGFAAALITTLAVATVRMTSGTRAPGAATGTDIFPQTPGETAVFGVFTVFVGAGWELLYRGYLLWALTPLTGQIGAILLAATAYGLAHGYKSNVQLGGSIAMALLFTAAYAVTGSLWWLIAIHIALPLIGWRAYRRMSPAER